MAADRRSLWEAHFDVGTLIEMHGVDEAHLPLVQRDDQRLRADAFAEEPHAAQYASLGHSRARENNFLSWRKIFCLIDALAVLNAHVCQALLVLGLGDYQPRQD